MSVAQQKAASFHTCFDKHICVDKSNIRQELFLASFLIKHYILQIVIVSVDDMKIIKILMNNIN